MMESAMEMEFLHKYLADDWTVAGYSVDDDVHHVLLRSATEFRALSFKTHDKTSNGQAEVIGYEESVLIS